MYISNKDLELLLKIESFLWNNTNVYYNNIDLYLELHRLNEKLLNIKDEKNKKNWERIKEKRKIDKFYGREKARREKYISRQKKEGC